ncbi:peptidase S24 [Escherichia coli]|nr:peptidase S24 [Escherichia coli]
MQNSLSVIKQPIIKPELLFGSSPVHDYGNMVMTCQMNGDSMQPKIEPGEVVAFVDCGGKIKLDGIYVFTRLVFGREVVFIKRIAVLPDNELMILSDHKAYQTYTLDEDEQADMKVYGRVVASLAVRRYV